MRNISRLLGWAAPLVGCMFALTACDDGAGDHFDARESGKLLAWIQEYHPGSSVGLDAHATFDDGILLIEAKPISKNKTNSLSIYNAGSYVGNTLTAYNKAASNKDALKIIKIVYLEEFVDKYGNSVGNRSALIIDFDVAEGLRYNFENVLAFGMVNDAKIEIDINHSAQDYCKEDREFSQFFCRLY